MSATVQRTLKLKLTTYGEWVLFTINSQVCMYCTQKKSWGNPKALILVKVSQWVILFKYVNYIRNLRLSQWKVLTMLVMVCCFTFFLWWVGQCAIIGDEHSKLTCYIGKYNEKIIALICDIMHISCLLRNSHRMIDLLTAYINCFL